MQVYLAYALNISPVFAKDKRDEGRCGFSDITAAPAPDRYRIDVELARQCLVTQLFALLDTIKGFINGGARIHSASNLAYMQDYSAWMQVNQGGIMRVCNIAEMQNDRYTSGMSEALGMYLKTLREGYKLKPSQVLAELSERLGKKIAWSRLSRTEKGEFDRWPEGDYLTALYDIVHADLADVAWIQMHPTADKRDGERLARGRIDSRAKALADQVPDNERPNAVAWVRSLRNDPEALRELRRLINDPDA